MASNPATLNNGETRASGGHWTVTSGRTLDIVLAGSRSVSEVVLVGNPGTTDDPLPNEGGTWPADSQFDTSRYTVQTWSGSAWQTVGSVSGNTLHIRRVSFAPVTTDRIRVIPTDDASNGQTPNDNLVSLTEIEVRSPAGAGEIRAQRFDAWGKLEQAAGSVPTYGYTGREPDATGLIHYRARYYHPEIGRFVSRDPLGLSAGINPYAYADGNPVLFNDPDGLMAALAWNSASSYWTSATNSVGSFLSGLDVGNTAEQFGRKLAYDFVQNNPGRAGDLSGQGWLSRQLAPYAQGYDGTTASGQAAGALVLGLGMTLPSDPGRKLDRVEGVIDAAKGGTYALKDAEGVVMRTGRSNDLARRELEHARDPKLKDLSLEVQHRTDVRAEQRGLEQMLHDQHNPPLNAINPISPRNSRFQEYMDAARRFLGGN